MGFIINRAGQSDETAAEALAEELGQLPLALEQAVTYISTLKIPIDEYLTEFQEQHKELFGERAPHRLF
ncbi:MAG: hypothetical protein ACXV5H_07045 [Halobacteriota archaeon]